MRKLATQTIDFTKDPYFIRNNIGSYECRLCLTIHTNEGSYLAHTQGKKHQTYLLRRQAKDQSLTQGNNIVTNNVKAVPKKRIIKIGRPGYRITKLKDADTGQRSILFEIEYTEILKEIIPRYRVISSFEQKLEPVDDKFQYVVFAADPYENIAFKIPNLEIDNGEDKYYVNWDKDKKLYSVQLYFREKRARNEGALPSKAILFNPLGTRF